MRRIRFIALCALAIAGATAADTAPAPGSPEEAILAPVQALRQNDVLAIFKSLPETDQQEAEKGWADAQGRPPSPEDAKLDGTLAMLNAPGAVDLLMAQLEPKLKEMDPNQLAFQLQMGAGMLGMMLASNPDGAPLAEAVQGITTDLVAWLPKAGVNDPEKARKALEQVVAAVKAFEVKDTAGLKALSLNELLDRTGKALKEFKGGFNVYGCDLDAFLDSIKVTDLKTEGDKAAGNLVFTVLGKPRTVPVKLVKKDGRWIADDSNFAALQQMQNGGAGADPEPTVPTSPEPVATP